jgi:hypothetical protein
MNSFTWPARRIRQTRQRQHWCIKRPAPPRVAWWAILRVYMPTERYHVVKFDGLELRLTLPLLEDV